MKIRQKVSLLILPLLALSGCRITAGITRNPTTSSTSIKPSFTMEMFKDNTFTNGFTVTPANGTRIGDGWIPENRCYSNLAIQYGDPKPTGSPLWSLRQHHDVYGLGDVYQDPQVQPQKNPETGYYDLIDTSKRVSIKPDAHKLYLEMDCSKEYSIRDLQEGEDWCHLLLESAFNQYDGDLVHVKDLISCYFSCAIHLDKFENHMRVTPNPKVHAAQFLMYFIMQSTAPQDADKYFYFGVPLYDNRYTVVPESGEVDTAGTGLFIYKMNSGIYLPYGLSVHDQGMNINFDIKPYFSNALALAQKKGFYTHSTVNDLVFSNMNIGYEISGTYDIGISLNEFSFTANFY